MHGTAQGYPVSGPKVLQQAGGGAGQEPCHRGALEPLRQEASRYSNKSYYDCKKIEAYSINRVFFKQNISFIA